MRFEDDDTVLGLGVALCIIAVWGAVLVWTTRKTPGVPVCKADVVLHQMVDDLRAQADSLARRADSLETRFVGQLQ